VERDLGLKCYPVTWPITSGDRFVGVYNRDTRRIHLFEKGEDHGSSRVETDVVTLDDPDVHERIGDSAYEQLMNDVELLEIAGIEFTREAFLAGEVSPTFFGSALTNFGVEPFLAKFLELAPSPTAREASTRMVEPEDPSFTGFVFKIQANMDPKHRDRIAFVRVCSGHFEAGMQVKHVRTRKMMRLSAPTQFLARERTHIEEAWPGDVIGIHDRGSLRIGDTLSADGDLEFAGIPRFSPQHFSRILIGDPMKRKQLDTGLQQLSEEGAAQVFYSRRTRAPRPSWAPWGSSVRRAPAPPGARVRREGAPGADVVPLRALGAGPRRRHPRALGRPRAHPGVRCQGGPPRPLRQRVDAAHHREREKSLTFHDVAP
jgi:peptide chain release factor 3